MLIIIELIFLVMGIIALATGKFTLGQHHVVRGAAARLLGIIAMVPLPLSLMCGFMIGFVYAANGGRHDRFNEAIRVPATILELGNAVVCLGLLYASGWRIAGQQAAAARAPAGDLYDRDADLQRQPGPGRAPREAREVGRQRREAQDPRDRRDPRDPEERRRSASPANLGLILGIVFGSLMLLGVVGTVVVVLVMGNSAEQRNNEAKKAFIVEMDRAQREGRGVWAETKKTTTATPIVEERKIPTETEKKEPVEPPEPPVAVTFTGGVFETPVDLSTAKRSRPGFNVSRSYLFDAQPDKAYLVEAKDTYVVNVRVLDPDGKPAVPEKGFGERRVQAAFIAQKAGAHTAIVACDRFDLKPFRLRIQEVDETEPLPETAKFMPEALVLPSLEQSKVLNVYDKQLGGAAFSLDNKALWLAHGDKTLSYWELPGMVEKGSYTLPSRLFSLGLDKNGRLYGQFGTADPSGGPRPPRAVTDISFWEKLEPPTGVQTMPKPTGTIPLSGIVKRLINAPDGRWLYALDVHNRKLLRIDPETAAVDKEIATLASGTTSFCLTPDGKTIYCCSSANKIDVIDTATFMLTKSLSLSRGQPLDVAATNAGLLFLCGEVLGERYSSQNCMMADLSKSVSDKVNVLPISTIGRRAEFVLMLPDERAALFSGDRVISVCSVPTRPALMKPQAREVGVRDYFMPGVMVLSPDGRTLAHDAAVILSVSR